jgi:hypothetical protein
MVQREYPVACLVCCKLADYAKYLDGKTIDSDSTKLEEEFDKEFGAAMKK